MRLFTKYNRVNVWVTAATFILGAAGFYFLLFYLLNKQLDDTLQSEQQEITEYVAAYGKLPSFQNTRQQWMTALPVTEMLAAPNIESYTRFNAKEGGKERIRRLVFTIKAGNVIYRVIVSRSQAETEDLLKLIIMFTLCMIGFMLVFNYVVNRVLVNKLLKPFYHTVVGIKNYAALEKPMQLLKTGIDEIDTLNTSLNDMTHRIHTEYKALKSFTENASHEMQTPLAVIRSKIELLLQNEKLREHDVKYILQIDDAAKRLTKLHQSLVLLTRLENRQFTTTDQVNMQQIVAAKVAEFEELFASKNILFKSYTQPANICLHPHLAEILTSNLLSNALRYTPVKGLVSVTLTDKLLVVSNTAIKGPLDANNVFRRFYKSDDGNEGTGLGLAIIKEIGNLASLYVEYVFMENRHVFNIHFNKHQH